MPIDPPRKRIRLIAFVDRRIFLIPITAVLAVLSILSFSKAVGAAPSDASDVRLIMIEDPGCPYCARWHNEVGIAYAASAEGRFAPLVRRGRNHPDVAQFDKIIYSPTFIVVRNGVEIGRIIGYSGPDFFWGFLARLLRQGGFQAQNGAP